MAPPILDQLKRQFYGSVRAKNQFYIDDRLRVVRFLAELVKFKVGTSMSMSMSMSMSVSMS